MSVQEKNPNSAMNKHTLTHMAGDEEIGGKLLFSVQYGNEKNLLP